MEIHEHGIICITIKVDLIAMRSKETPWVVWGNIEQSHPIRGDLFGALVELNSPVFQAVGRFLDFTISQSLKVKL